MATTTLAVLFQQLCEYVGDWYTGTADTNTDATDITDTELDDIISTTDSLAGYWARADPGETNTPEIRRRSAVTLSPTVIEMSRDFSSAVTAGDVYTLHRYNPADYVWAINAAIRSLFPNLYLPITDETLIVDSLLENGTFENFTGTAPDNWTLVSSPTTAKETNIKKTGRASLSITGGTGDQATQIVYPNLTGVGATITVKGLVKTEAATSARFGINAGGSTVNSDFHGGDGSWEELTVSDTFAADDEPITVRIEIDTSDQAYVDKITCIVGEAPIYHYPVPSTIKHGPHFVSMQALEANPNGPFRPVNRVNPLRQGRILRLEGMGILSSLSADTDTVEIGDPRTELLVAKAGWHFWTRQYGQTRNEDDKKLRDIAFNDVQLLLRTPGVRMRAMSAEVSNYWNTFEDSTGIVLDFGVLRETELLVT